MQWMLLDENGDPVEGQCFQQLAYDNQPWILVDEYDEPVGYGAEVTSFRGDTSTLVSATPPHKFGSTGRVYTKDEDRRHLNERFPSVYGLVWVRVQELETK